MKKIITLGTLLLSCCFVVSAQAGSMQNDNTRPTTVQGCLSQASDGSYILADSYGNRFQLRGDTAQLSGAVDNEIRVKGNFVSDSGMYVSAMASPTGHSMENSQLSVDSVRNIESCSDWNWRHSTNSIR